MRLSVVLLTYQRPDALALALRGLARQTRPADEVVVTDDGSSSETRACVERLAPGFPSRLTFVTHPRRGPRMSEARNRGVAAARGDYLVFLDGDQIPSPRFVADHAAFARPGTFVQGSRALAGPALTQRLLLGGSLDVPPLASGLSRRRHALRIPALWWLFGRRRRSPDGLKSCNLAFWRAGLPPRAVAKGPAARRGRGAPLARAALGPGDRQSQLGALPGYPSEPKDPLRAGHRRPPRDAGRAARRPPPWSSRARRRPVTAQATVGHQVERWSGPSPCAKGAAPPGPPCRRGATPCAG
jgi:Glycosyl transferase family 2